MSLISLKRISFSYPNSDKKAVDDVSFVLENGSYTALVGSNGSGKSTLAKIICGLQKQTSGLVSISEGSRIGLVFQSPKNQIVSSIVSRDTAFGPQSLGLKKSEVELRTIECLNITEMLDKALSSTSALSLGQTQKVAMSGMLAIWPDILILDEALSMLDAESRKSMYEIMAYWHKMGKTIVHITHSLESIKQADNVIAMEKGKMIFYGTSSAFFADDELVAKIRGPELPKSQARERVDAQEVSFAFDNVNFSYDKKSSVNDISFELKKGSITALSGPSGAGKSTVLELASGLLSPSQGKISSVSRPVLAQQNCETALFEAFAADDVAFGPRNRGIDGNELKKLVKKSMDDASIPFKDFADRHTFSLSGGEQRRLAIAGILALNADVVLFDEPTAGLDGHSRYNVMQMLKKLAEEGKTVLFSTHKQDEIDFADREIRMEKGRIIFDSQKQAEPLNQTLTEQSAYPAVSMITGLRESSAKLAGHEKMSFSPIHALHPVARIVLFLALFAVSVAFYNIYVNASLFVLSIVYCILCGFNIKKLLSSQLKLLPFLLIFTVMQIVFRPALPDEVLYTTWKWFTLSPSKLMFCLCALLKTYASLGFVSGFFISTPEYDLIDGVKILLTPLIYIKVPVRYFILILEVIFRFIPILIDEASGIIKTQVMRGGMGKAKSKIQKIKAMIPLVVPLIIQTIKRSDYLADAVTMRGFK